MHTALLTDTVSSDLDRAVGYALLWGLDAVALRTFGKGERVPHVNEARLRHRLTEADLPVAVVDPGLFEAPHTATPAWLNDLAAFGETAQFCQRVGCPMVISGALAGPAAEEWDEYEAGRIVARLAREGSSTGLRIAVRNDDTTCCRSGEDLSRLLTAAREACGSRAERDLLGAAWSPMAAHRAGQDAAAGLDALRAGGVPIYCVRAQASTLMQDEGVDWGRQMRALREMTFGGPIVLEVDARPAGPAGLRASNAMLALIRSRP